MTRSRPLRVTVPRLALLVAAAALLGPVRAEAQLGALLSPGRLTRAHADLEGIVNCQKCHERGQRITAAKCLSCHRPVADRMARKVGVHRDVTDDCVTCHVEHTGLDGELRPFDQDAFDHARVAGFPLDGKHADLEGGCAACHTTRSFLTASPACQSCHTDVHEGRLGTTCASCHTTTVAFKDVVAGGRFDHGRTAFPLDGAHVSVACTSCHADGAFTGVAFSSCTSCHADPHRPAQGARCTSCHTTGTWRTGHVNHARTAFPLVGRHEAVACAACHTRPAMTTKPPSGTCAACHVDVHRGTFTQDCKACHAETGFENAPFDHDQTGFPLAGRHAPLACAACHTGVDLRARSAARRVADYRGLDTACASCHPDVHRGELGTQCDTCHSAASFSVDEFEHSRFPDFFEGEHAGLACERCHRPAGAARGAPGGPPGRGFAADASAKADVPMPATVRFTRATTACASCHTDVHLGQVGAECQACHDVRHAGFAVAGFSHATTAFPLTGRHETVACAACHMPTTGVFPAGASTAVRLAGLAVECVACHQDVHQGQADLRCERCHTSRTFALPDYRHPDSRLVDFFVGRHLTTSCESCHRPVPAEVPSGRGTVLTLQVDTSCTACHRDVHNGSLPDCASCHVP